jgi:predicted RNase H-like HicB family nuclease
MNKKLHAIHVQTQYGRYECVLEPDERRGFVVTVPGLDGVITWGKNIAHAKKMVKEAIELCVECRVGETLRRAKTESRVPSRELAKV